LDWAAESIGYREDDLRALEGSERRSEQLARTGRRSWLRLAPLEEAWWQGEGVCLKEDTPA
jgi:hypothetical protein